jgi:adenylate cyclase
MDTIATYLPQDRLQALARGETLPDRTTGAALFADISGFTPLTERLTGALGPRRGAEELTRHLNDVYDALIREVDRYGGSVIGFAGDAITCWFDDERDGAGLKTEGNKASDSASFVFPPASLRAGACAMALQQAMQPFGAIALPGGATTALGLKVTVASGPARRFAVGDPNIQLLDALAGATISRTAAAEHLASRGEVLFDLPTVAALGTALQVGEWREAPETRERFAVVQSLPISLEPSPWPTVLQPPSAEQLRPWLLPAVYEREQSGQGAFLTEFRPAVALFLRFVGLDYDSDEAGSQLDAFIRCAQDVLFRYEGTLLQLTIGDKGSYLYAPFGAPTAHEDDARRAMKAALELQAAAVRTSFSTPVQIGISYGTMRAGVYGGSTRRIYGVMGDEVNLAARLMQTAEPGEILVAGRVQQAAGEGFSIEPRAPLRMRGKAEPLPVCAVTGMQQRRAIRLQEPTYALPMIGRQQELAVIEEKMTLALQGRGQIVGIIAEAGMGKSRLIAEVIRIARRRKFTGYGGTCQSDGVNTSYLVWHSIWNAVFDLDPAVPLRKQLRALESEIEGLAPERAGALPVLGAVLGLSIPDDDFTRGLEPKERKSVLEALLVDCLRSAAHEAGEDGGALLFVLDDLHWIDQPSHDLLEELARASANLPVLIMLAYRAPDLQRLQVPRVEALPHFTRIALKELDAAQSEQAIRAKLAQLFPERGGAVPAVLIERITMQAQGNPFYVEELLNYLRDRGLDPRDPAALDRIELPASLHSLILSRLDQLTAHQRLMLKVASIIGRRFDFDHLHGYYPTLGEPGRLKADLDTLAAIDLTPLETTEPKIVYLFKHIVTRDVAYESLAYATRAALHEQYARYLENLVELRLAPALPLDLLAYHYDRSENPAKKREYLRRAGEAAQAAYANAAALDYYERLLPLLTEASERSAIQLKMGAVLELIGRWAEAEALYWEALTQAEDAQNPLTQAQCQQALGILYRQRGDYDAALAWFEQAEKKWITLDDRAGFGQVLTEMGTVLLRKGEYAAAQQHLDKSFNLARELGNRAGMALALYRLGEVSHESDHAATQALWEESLALWRELDNKPGIAAILNSLGVVASEQGDYPAARMLHEESLALRRELGDKRGIAVSLLNLGVLAEEQGDYAVAQALYQENLALRRELGDKQGIAMSLGNLGIVAVEQGDYATARGLYQESMTLYRNMGDKRGFGYITLCQGLLAQAEGHLEQARMQFREGLEQFQAINEKRHIATGLAALAIAAAEQSAGARAEFFARRAAQLGGATNALLESLKTRLERHFGLPYEHALTAARATLGKENFAAAQEAGRHMTLEEAITFALSAT